MDGKMTRDEALRINEMYQWYDEEARAAKKRGDHNRAAEYRHKRDALHADLVKAIEVLRAL